MGEYGRWTTTTSVIAGIVHLDKHTDLHILPGTARFSSTRLPFFCLLFVCTHHLIQNIFIGDNQRVQFCCRCPPCIESFRRYPGCGQNKCKTGTTYVCLSALSISLFRTLFRHMPAPELDAVFRFVGHARHEAVFTLFILSIVISTFCNEYHETHASEECRRTESDRVVCERVCSPVRSCTFVVILFFYQKTTDCSLPSQVNFKHAPLDACTSAEACFRDKRLCLSCVSMFVCNLNLHQTD